MTILVHKKFERDFANLSSHQQTRVYETISLFLQNPFDPILKNHPLKGKKRGYRSLHVAGDLRIIFQEQENYSVVKFYRVGSHNQVY